MAPDLNSLPTSPPATARSRRMSLTTGIQHDASRASPPSPSLSSLQAAATINASLHRPASRTSPARSAFDRRRSSLINNLSLNDPAVPSPGELQQSNTSSPRTGRRSFGASTDNSLGRQISLGELHQELENEQEAQVNRLLHMIRLQQDQLAALSRTRSSAQDEQSPTTSESAVLPTPPLTSTTPNADSPRTSITVPITSHFHRPQSLSRQSSSRLSISGTGSRGASPALRPTSASLGPLTEDFLLGGTRDECAFYQAETHMLTRENQMLKHRIRELERQIAEQGQVPVGSLSPLASSSAGPTATSRDESETKD